MSVISKMAMRGGFIANVVTSAMIDLLRIRREVVVLRHSLNRGSYSTSRMLGALQALEYSKAATVITRKIRNEPPRIPTPGDEQSTYRHFGEGPFFE